MCKSFPPTSQTLYNMAEQDQKHPGFLSRLRLLFTVSFRSRANRNGVVSKPPIKDTAEFKVHSARQHLSVHAFMSLPQQAGGQTNVSRLGALSSDATIDVTIQPLTAPTSSFGDRERTEMRYNEAAKQLEKCLAIRKSICESLTLFDFDEICQNNQVPYLRGKIDEMLQARKSLTKNRNVMERIFTAITPFSKRLLTVLIQSQPVPLPSYHNTDIIRYRRHTACFLLGFCF